MKKLLKKTVCIYKLTLMLKRLRGDETDTEEEVTRRRKALFAHLPSRPPADAGYETQTEELALARTQPVRVSTKGRKGMSVNAVRELLGQVLRTVPDKSDQRIRILTYVLEQQAKERERQRSVRRRFSLSLTYMRDLQKRQMAEILKLYGVSELWQFPQAFEAAKDKRHPSLTCAVVVTMHSHMDVAPAGSWLTRYIYAQELETAAFVVPPNVSITRLTSATHTYSYASVQRATVHSVETIMREELGDAYNLFPVYSLALDAVRRAMAAALESDKECMEDEILHLMVKLQQEYDRTLSLPYYLKREELIGLIEYAGTLVPREPQLLLPGERCPNKTYVATASDVKKVGVFGVTVVCPVDINEPTQAEKGVIELVSAQEVSDAVEQIQSQGLTGVADWVELPYCTVFYTAVTGPVVVTTLERIVKKLSDEDNFRNFIVVDYSCNAPTAVIAKGTQMVLAPSRALTLLGEKAAESGVAGGGKAGRRGGK